MMVMVTVMVMITYYGGREYDHYLVSRTLVSGQSTFHSILHFTLYSILIYSSLYHTTVGLILMKDL